MKNAKLKYAILKSIKHTQSFSLGKFNCITKKTAIKNRWMNPNES